MRIFFKIIYSALIVAACLLQQSCVKQFGKFDDMHKIQKGMTTDQVAKVMDMKVDASFDFNQDNLHYAVDMYAIILDQVTSSNGKSSTTVITTQPFLFVFKERKLSYWGFLNEFSKSEDPEIQNLSSRIYKEYYRVYVF